ncbi:phospholipase D family protein [Alloalcanivorax sp. C16-1]|uniref:phospholipase D family protein n=1 Tax=Alloalcanivorax sp. C16-1 TaxID=3390051 RepID=UPI0039707119
MSEGADQEGADAPTSRVRQSRFCLLPDSEEAFVLRAATARLAEKTLDLQYYIWDDDRIGKLLVYRTLEAARRGVRVRLLLDHANQLGRDVKWAALNAHPNVEIRLFNPFRGRYKHIVQWLYHAPRLNHRMHNKAWIADGEHAIVGGRNISDHYFGVHPEANFRDLDLYARGPIVEETREAFESYWNSDVTVHLRTLKRRSLEDADRLWEELNQWCQALDDFPYHHQQDPARFEQIVRDADARQITAPAALLFDTPDKAKGVTQRLMGDQLAELLSRRSLREILIEAGYFIPGDDFVRTLGAMHANGGRIALLTNGLATNDVIAAHAAYAHYRRDLIEAGVEVHELQPNARARRHLARLKPGRSMSALHTKAMVLDRSELFVGSFNLDPRSANLNTEMGYYVNSEALAARVAAFIEEGMAPQNSYRVGLDDQGRLEWGAGDERGPVRYHREPRVSKARWLASRFFGLLPIENLL